MPGRLKRLSPVFTDEEVIIIDSRRGSASRAAFLRRTIQTLAGLSPRARDRLVQIPLPTLPTSGAPRVDVRMDAALYARFKEWLGGKLGPGDAIRAYLHAQERARTDPPRGPRERPGLYAGKQVRSATPGPQLDHSSPPKADPPRRRAPRSATAAGNPGRASPTAAKAKPSSRPQTPRPARRQPQPSNHPRPKSPNAVRPAPTRYPRPGASVLPQLQAERDSSSSGLTSFREILDRHIHPERYAPNSGTTHDPFPTSRGAKTNQEQDMIMGLPTGIEIDVETADERDTRLLFKAIDQGEDVRLAKTATRSFLAALASLLNQSPDGTEIRILLGAWTPEEEAEEAEDPDEWDDDFTDLDEDEEQDDGGEDGDPGVALLGLRDPGRVAHQVKEQLRAARRSGTATVRTHLGVETDSGELVDLVELEAYLD